MLMKPEGSAECHQTLSLWVGSGDETTPWQVKGLHMHGSLFSVLVGLPYGWQQFQDDDSNQVFVE